MSLNNENLESRLNSLFEGLRAGVDALQETRDQLNTEFALDFNPIGLFRPDENQMSRILAFLLNPRANHGQGDVFLECFCKAYCGDLLDDFAPQHFENAQVTTEHLTASGRRIDILVKLVKPGKQKALWVGIENKIWAGDQDAQLSDYQQFLKEVSSDNYVLLYLSPHGRTPSDNSIPKKTWDKLKKTGHFLCVSYVNTDEECQPSLSLCSLVDEFMAKCAAEDVKRFLRLLQRYWKVKFLGEKAMDVSNFVAEYVTRDDKLELAWKIVEQENHLKEAIWERVKAELIEWSKSEGADLEICAQTYGEMKGAWTKLLLFKLPIPAGWRLRFEFSTAKRSELITILSGSSQDDNNQLGLLISSTGYKKRNPENIHIYKSFAPYHGDWENGLLPWRHMLEPSNEYGLSLFSKALIDEYRRITGILEQEFSR